MASKNDDPSGQLQKVPFFRKKEQVVLNHILRENPMIKNICILSRTSISISLRYIFCNAYIKRVCSFKCMLYW